MSERPLFKPNDLRKLYAINAGGPLNPHYWNQLTEGMDIHTAPSLPEADILAPEAVPSSENHPIEIILVDMSDPQEVKHISHAVNPLEPEPLP